MNRVNLQTKERMQQVFAKDHTLLKSLSTKLSNLESQGLLLDHIQTILKKRIDHLSIPLSLFSCSLSPLESLVYYLHHIHKLSLSQIASITLRNQSTIWTTLHLTKQKMTHESFTAFVESLPSSAIYLPLSLFSTRSLSILENICYYLHTTYALSYRAIALALHKNDRTIWTVVNRAQKKLTRRRTE